MFVPPAALLFVALHGTPASAPPQTPPAPTTQSCIKPRRSYAAIVQAAARAIADVARNAVH